VSRTAPSRPYDETYYRELCGQKQTRFDRARDDRVVELVGRHAPPLRPGSALLDIGCGYGHLLKRFASRYRLAGIDVSEHAAGVAGERVPGAVIVVGDLQRPFPFSQRFDVVLAINVLEHLPDPVAGVGAIHTALADGGLCVVHLPTINGPVSRLIYRMAYSKDPTHIYRPSGKEVRRLFESQGLVEVESSYAPHRRWLGSGLGWHPAYLGAFRRS
jgi:SAM-dependent methyltransferase